MIDDKTLDKMFKSSPMLGEPASEEMRKLIKALRKEREDRQALLMQKKVLIEALDLILHPTKIGEHGDPWFYRQSRARAALDKVKESIVEHISTTQSLAGDIGLEEKE